MGGGCGQPASWASTSVTPIRCWHRRTASRRVNRHCATLACWCWCWRKGPQRGVRVLMSWNGVARERYKESGGEGGRKRGGVEEGGQERECLLREGRVEGGGVEVRRKTRRLV